MKNHIIIGLCLIMTITPAVHSMMESRTTWHLPESFKVTVRIHTRDGVFVNYFDMKKADTVGHLQKKVAHWLGIEPDCLKVMATKREYENAQLNEQWVDDNTLLKRDREATAIGTVVETTILLTSDRFLQNDKEFGTPIAGIQKIVIQGKKYNIPYTLGYNIPTYDVISILEANQTDDLIKQFQEIIIFGKDIKRISIAPVLQETLEHKKSKTDNAHTLEKKLNNDFSDFK